MPLLSLHLADEAATKAVARTLCPVLGAADTLLLEGPIGAGKSLFARAVIQTLLAAEGRSEEVPSPTYTLVQTYRAGALEIWHADLYRLGMPEETEELGLTAAFETALCLVEWPDRLSDLAPAGALWLDFAPTSEPGARTLTFRGPADRWSRIRPALARFADSANA